MTRSSVVAFVAIVMCTAFAASTPAQARCFSHCRQGGWPHNQWGYVGLVQGGWGLGGVADRPWVGGSIIAVSSYGPYPYSLYPFELRP